MKNVVHENSGSNSGDRAGSATSSDAESILRAAPVPFLVLRTDLRVNTASDSFCQTFGVTPGQTEGRIVFEIGNGQWNIPQLRESLEEIVARGSPFNGLEVTHQFPAIGQRTMLLSGRTVEGPLGVRELILLGIEDITARHAAETALRDARQRLEQTLTITEVATWTWDVVEDRVFADRNLARLFSVSPQDAEGGPIAHYVRAIHPEDRPGAEAVIAEAMQSESGEYQMDYRLVQADGSIRWVTARGQAERDDAGQIIRFPGVIIDNTGRKHTELLLQHNRDTFSNLIENAPFGVFVIDSDFRILEVSAGSRGAFRNVDPLIGRDLTEALQIIWGEQLAGEVAALFRRTLETGEPYAAPPLTEQRADLAAIESYDWKIERIALPSGQWGVVCYFYDVTERVQSENALRESEERFRHLSDNIPQLAWMADAEGSIFWYNRRWFHFTGATLEEMQGWGWETVHHPDHLARVVKKWRHHLAAGEDWEDTFPLRSREGQYRWFLSRAFPIKNASGKVERWFGTNTDVTEQREAVEVLAKAKEQVEAASRAKDDFLAALSHELRTPLTPVLMTAAALESDPALPPEIREQLSMMRRNLELEARLIDDLLDITRISRGKLAIAPVPVDLHQLITHTAEIMRSDELGKQIRLRFQLDAERPCALADPTRMQQVFWNLLKNALKFTPAGGTVTVRTRNDNEGWIVTTFEDTGIGIAPKALPFIFNAFEQGDVSGQHRYGGLGLGLAISQAIMEVHGGLIRAESPGEGHGATFTVALASVDPPLPASTRRAAPEAPARSLRLLVIEDHEATRTVLRRLLTRRGHTVTTAETAQEARHACTDGRFDAIISDLGLPDGSGLDLMRELQSLRPVPAIALSGYGMEEDIRQSREAGFFAHLVKPVNVDQLLTLLNQVTIP